MLQGIAQQENKLAYSVNEISNQTSLSKAYLRNEIRDGKLKAKKVGRRVLILSADLQFYLESKEDWTPSDQEEINLGVKN